MRLAQTFPLIAANEFIGRGAAVSAKLSRERAAEPISVRKKSERPLDIDGG